MLARLGAWLVRPTPPKLVVGVLVCALFLAVETLLVYPLSRLAPREALAVIFLLGVLVVSTVWRLWLAVVMSFVSAFTFNFFPVAPEGRFTVRDSHDWAELAVFLVVAVLASSVGQLARSRAVEALERHREAQIFIGLTRLMLSTDDMSSVLPEASRRLSHALDLPFADLHLGEVAAGAGRVTFPLRYHARVGTLVVPAGLPDPMVRRLEDRVVPALAMVLRAASDREEMSDSLRASRDELRALVTEQQVLRRVAVLVAQGAPPSDVVAAVAAETAWLLDADATRLMRAEVPGTVTVLAEYSKPGMEPLLGKRLKTSGGATELVLNTGRPAHVDSYEVRAGALAELARREGFHASVGAPIVVEGRMWGALVVLWSRHLPPPSDAESRLAQFTELVATAVANTESQGELKASRARIVFAADEARRSFERDLHDGLQQRLVSLGLELRAAEAMVPSDHDELRARLSQTTEGLSAAFQDLQEITRGLHPAILSQGGLGPALKALARRCPIPVTMDPGPKRRLPSCVEVAAYYVVSEALTNVAKHAQSDEAYVDINIAEDGSGHECLTVSIRDDGVGGADPGLGSGLVGLTDRVEALGGQLQLTSPAGYGTTLVATLPVDVDCTRPPHR
ncbi:hypothetical protein GCM10010399_82980 [Dactylosporangium fulvum]|uniref:histidine kinase n=1 Tax=Dactylosporangium fulvum TaxID=53359 RepID=A0ABY5WE72_9ACTN|nr:DUF4118 domain-containing protein [Dactylosporangium fulvum]UWP87566.1 DUF4118 domain-containing protein [Dactylosporangium fulvum]